MTKEQMTAALEQTRAENGTLKKKVAELETEIGKLNTRIESDAKEDQAGQDSANAMIAELERSCNEWKAMYEGAQELPRKKPEPTAEKTQIETLAAIIADSCADHCPHHADPEACRNCGIYKRLTAAGITITPKKEA